MVFDVASDGKASTSHVYGDWKHGTFTSNNTFGILDIECKDGHQGFNFMRCHAQLQEDRTMIEEEENSLPEEGNMSEIHAG